MTKMLLMKILIFNLKGITIVVIYHMKVRLNSNLLLSNREYISDKR